MYQVSHNSDLTKILALPVPAPWKTACFLWHPMTDVPVHPEWSLLLRYCVQHSFYSPIRHVPPENTKLIHNLSLISSLRWWHGPSQRIPSHQVCRLSQERLLSKLVGQDYNLFSKLNVLFLRKNTTCKQLGPDICYDLNQVQGALLSSVL